MKKVFMIGGTGLLGSKSAEQRANEKWKKILAENPDPCIDSALDAEMAAYVKKYNG